MYGIMRIEKRGRAAVYGLQIEANRTAADHEKGRDFERSDIDWAKTEKNKHLRYCKNWNTEITSQLKSHDLKERKDSIVLLDAVYTASPEFFSRRKPEVVEEFFRKCLAFHEKEYGPAINAVMHFDEKTPHMQVASIPIIKDEKGWHLSAKLVMGNRTEYRNRQDRFYSQVSSFFGLERGEVRDPAEMKEHTTKREWQIMEQRKQIEKNERKLSYQEEQISQGQVLVSRARDVTERAIANAQNVTAEKSEAEKELASIKAKIEQLTNFLVKNTPARHKARWKNKETLEVDRELYEALCRTARESAQLISRLEDNKTAADQDRKEAALARQEAESLLQEEKEKIDTLAEELVKSKLDALKIEKQNAENARKRAEELERTLISQIQSQASAALEKALEFEETDFTKRIMEYMSGIYFPDGRSALDKFILEEEKREMQIKEKVRNYSKGR